MTLGPLYNTRLLWVTYIRRTVTSIHTILSLYRCNVIVTLRLRLSWVLSPSRSTVSGRSENLSRPRPCVSYLENTVIKEMTTLVHMKKDLNRLITIDKHSILYFNHKLHFKVLSSLLMYQGYVGSPSLRNSIRHPGGSHTKHKCIQESTTT